MKLDNSHGGHLGKIIWGDRIITEAPRLACKYNVTYVINENSREIYWALQ